MYGKLCWSNIPLTLPGNQSVCFDMRHKILKFMAVMLQKDQMSMACLDMLSRRQYFLNNLLWRRLVIHAEQKPSNCCAWWGRGGDLGLFCSHRVTHELMCQLNLILKSNVQPSVWWPKLNYAGNEVLYGLKGPYMEISFVELLNCWVHLVSGIHFFVFAS